ncbi:MAG: phosphonate ABC transporter, permease protein PhnE, partial [Paracoccus sp. (in: a-proteobacteria)]|nr:phosphonate ABC transporter, permease protein PhnE [Paracoccus sp. (in: a-proteobacteria)]
MAQTALATGPLPLMEGADIRAAYLEMTRRKRMYGGILLVLFVALMASGFLLA